MLVGKTAEVSWEYVGRDGVPFDPVTVSLRVLRPDSQVDVFDYPTDPEIVKVSTVRYRCDVPVTLAGTWAARAVGTGTTDEVIWRAEDPRVP
jgi:hypothetical protein